MKYYEIKSLNGKVLFRGKFESLKECVEATVKEGAYLRGANLEGTDLRGAYLRGANLEGAYLEGAYLRGANLRGANLEGTDLRGADLWGSVGNSKEVKSLQLETYNVNYTHLHLQIGCEKHLIEDWKTFSKERIFAMDQEKAVIFWDKWKDTLFKLIEMSPAKPTQEHKN